MAFQISEEYQAILDRDAKAAEASVAAYEANVKAEMTGLVRPNWSQFYRDLYAAITVNSTIPVDGGDLLLSSEPAPGVDRGVWVWIRGAIGVNSGTGALGQYIRDYTAKQFVMRTGAAPADLDDRIQKSSNTIAANVYDTLLRGSWLVPNLYTIGQADAAGAAADVFKGDSSSTGDPNRSPWAGTVEFAPLGENRFFKDWVLTNGRSDAKQEVGTYDLVSIAEAETQLKTLGLAFNVILKGDLGTALETFSLGSAAVAEAIAKANAFFANTYGSAVSSIDIGDAVFDLTTDVTADSRQFMVGTLKGQSVIVGPSRQVVVGGPGDDSFTASFLSVGHPVQYAARVLDGGPGDNALTYQTALVPLTATLKKVERGVSASEAAYQGAPKLTMQVTDHAGSFTDNDYNFQSVTLGAGKNTFALGPGLTKDDLVNGDGTPVLKSLDGGSSGENTLDLWKFGGNLTANVAKPIGSAGAPYTVNIQGLFGDSVFSSANFQTVKLGSGDDTFDIQSGTDTSTLKTVDGGGGNNTIHAGGGSKTAYYGGSYGTNVLYGAATFDEGTLSKLVGGPSADDIRYHADNPDLPSLGDPGASGVTIHAGPSSAIMIGGPGKNTFYVENADGHTAIDVVWGGGGQSAYYLNGAINVCAVNIQGATAENISALSPADLYKMSGLDPSLCDGSTTVFVVNPGESDTLSYGGIKINGSVDTPKNDDYYQVAVESDRTFYDPDWDVAPYHIWQVYSPKYIGSAYTYYYLDQYNRVQPTKVGDAADVIVGGEPYPGHVVGIAHFVHEDFPHSTPEAGLDIEEERFSRSTSDGSFLDSFYVIGTPLPRV